MLLEGLVEPNHYTYNDKVYYELPARMAWSLTHYDGPMTGIAIYRGKHYYAKCHQSICSRKPRYYWLYPLTLNEYEKEVKYQEWFRKCVGMHCDYDENGNRQIKPRTWWDWWRDLIRPVRNLKSLNPNYIGPDYIGKQKELEIDRENYLKRQAAGYFERDSFKEQKYLIQLRENNPEKYKKITFKCGEKNDN